MGKPSAESFMSVKSCGPRPRSLYWNRKCNFPSGGFQEACVPARFPIIDMEWKVASFGTEAGMAGTGLCAGGDGCCASALTERIASQSPRVSRESRTKPPMRARFSKHPDPAKGEREPYELL